MTHPRPPPQPRGRSWRETSCPYGQGLGSRLGEVDRPTVQQVYQCRQFGATRRFHRSARTLCQRRETPSAAGDLRGVRQTEEMRSVFVRLAVTSEPSSRTISAASITAFRVFLSVCFLSSRRSVCQHFLRHLADPGGNDRLRNPIAASLPPDRPRLRREGRVLDAAPVCSRSHLLLALTTVPHISSAGSAPILLSAATACVNDHGYGQYQLAKRGIASIELDDGLLDCAAPERLRSSCAEITAGRIEALRRRG